MCIPEELISMLPLTDITECFDDLQRKNPLVLQIYLEVVLNRNEPLFPTNSSPTPV